MWVWWGRRLRCRAVARSAWCSSFAIYVCGRAVLRSGFRDTRTIANIQITKIPTCFNITFNSVLQNLYTICSLGEVCHAAFVKKQLFCILIPVCDAQLTEGCTVLTMKMIHVYYILHAMVRNYVFSMARFYWHQPTTCVLYKTTSSSLRNMDVGIASKSTSLTNTH